MDDYLFNPDHSWFKHLFESSPDPAWIIYGNRFVECNDAAISILGYSNREELLNVHPSKLSPAIQPDGEDSFAKAERMMAIAKDKGLHRFEWTHIKTDSSVFDAEVTLSVFELQGRQVIYCVWRDITERKQAYDVALRYQEIFENINDGVFVLEVEWDEEDAPHFRFAEMNPAMVRMGKLYQGNVLGRYVEECVPEDAAQKMNANYRRCVEAGKPIHYDFELEYSGGTMIFNSTLVPMLDGKGRVYRIICVTRDITALKQTRNQLRQLNHHILTVREEEKAYLAREIHDELGSTLAALKIEAHFMRRELSADQKTKPLVTRVESILQLLDSTIASARRITTNLRPTVLDTLGLLSALQWQADQFQNHTGIECRVDCISRTDYDCANSCNGCEDRLDEPLSINLFRICQEALTNAARHSGASRVKIEFQPCHHEIALSISDNGRGFPEGHKIAPTSFGIRGMRERIEQLGGKIGFDSQIGGGVSVMVKLPLPANISGKA